MGSYWALAPHKSAEFELALTQVTGLMQKLGQAGRHAVAEDLLRLIGARVPLAQCAIFSYEGGGRPRCPPSRRITWRASTRSMAVWP